MTYLYLLKYPPNEKELCQMEMRALFDLTPIADHFFSERMIPAGRSVFIKYRLEIIEAADSFAALDAKIKKGAYRFEKFKMLYLPIKGEELHYQDWLQQIRQLADTLDGSFDLHAPKQYLGMTYTKGKWYFGKVDVDNQSWSRFQDKPNTYSMSLSARDARILVNLAVREDYSKTLVDPCCGVGTIVLDGLGQGLDIEGYEIKKNIAYRARQNLVHYDFERDRIKPMDMHLVTKHYDVALLDIPYGYYAPITHDEQLALLQGCHRMTNELVLVTMVRMDAELTSVGYTIVDHASAIKMKFQRHVYLARRK